MIGNIESIDEDQIADNWILRTKENTEKIYFDRRFLREKIYKRTKMS